MKLVYTRDEVVEMVAEVAGVMGSYCHALMLGLIAERGSDEDPQAMLEVAGGLAAGEACKALDLPATSPEAGAVIEAVVRHANVSARAQSEHVRDLLWGKTLEGG